jgi:hypothetical protein
MGLSTAKWVASSVAKQQCSCEQVCRFYHQVPHSPGHLAELNAIGLPCVKQEVEQPCQEVTHNSEKYGALSNTCCVLEPRYFLSSVSDVLETTTRKLHMQSVQKDKTQTTLDRCFEKQQILITVRDTERSSLNETL